MKRGIVFFFWGGGGGGAGVCIKQSVCSCKIICKVLHVCYASQQKLNNLLGSNLECRITLQTHHMRYI